VEREKPALSAVEGRVRSWKPGGEGGATRWRGKPSTGWLGKAKASGVAVGAGGTGCRKQSIKIELLTITLETDIFIEYHDEGPSEGFRP